MARNQFFRFKQFTVDQEHCAMKVCTDACVLGAWAPLTAASRILDIGAGTGLLSLMAAQRNPSARIDAVEIEAAACRQARQNVENSLFRERIRLYEGAIQSFVPEKGYDCILTNPPFFQNSLRSPDAEINTAHHAGTLNFASLEAAISRLLLPGGSWHVVLPVPESDVLQELAERQGWRLMQTLLLAHRPGMKPFRRLATYGRKPGTEESAVVPMVFPVLRIYREDGKTYQPEFIQLLKEFYLAF